MAVLALYGLYDTKNNDVCLGLFTIYELMEYTHMKRDSIYQMIHKKCLFKHRYEIIKFNEMEMMKDD